MGRIPEGEDAVRIKFSAGFYVMVSFWVGVIAAAIIIAGYGG
jgi:hypothetical protein